MRKWTILLGLGLASGCFAKTRVVTLGSDAAFKGQGTPASEEHMISPYIYGFGTYLQEDRKAQEVWELKPTAYRWGGNTSSRYNYLTNSWNSARDWYFHNYSGGRTSIIDTFMAENRERGVASIVTVPILGWVAKDGTSVGFPKKLYPEQDGFDGDAGNGLFQGKELKGKPSLTSIAISPQWVGTWVKKLKTQFGNHPHFYIMDNEPMLWNSTHHDVQPEPMTYDVYLKKYIEYAAAVRSADPDAIIIGPALWGWLAMQQSAFDNPGPWSKGKRGVDRAAHGDKPFLEWFLEEVSKEEKIRKVSLLDIIDVHFYPERSSWASGSDSSPSVRKQLMRSSRSLWDPNFTDESWINEKMKLIPRLKAMAAKFKPSAKVSLGEYNYRSEKDVSGALAQADTLGIMGREDLYAAQYWDFPTKDGTHREAFRLFRNFDGKGAAFGERYLPNSAGVDEEYSVYTAEDKEKKRLTLVLINKSLGEEQTFDLKLDAYGQAKSGRIVGFVGSSKEGALTRYETSLPRRSLQAIKVKTKPLSMQIVELTY